MRRKRKPLLRRVFDDLWYRTIDAIVMSHLSDQQAGQFRLVGGRVSMHLPDGRRYEGWARGVGFIVGSVHGQSASDVLRDDALNADGVLPAHWPHRVDLWPLQVKVFKASRDGLRRGLAWLPHARGRAGGEVYRITAWSRGPDLVGVVVRLSAYRHITPDQVAALDTE